MQFLPIDLILPEIVATLSTSPNLILEAPPGAGKTTRVPAALLDAEVAGDREVWVLEPRRLAARLAARRVAEERNEKLGETVGYQVRFEEVAGPHTRLRFLTEGVLTRRLLSDPNLKNVGLVALDEFHERHLQADLALALLRRLQRANRPDLKLVVMSATLEAAPIASFLDDAPVLRSEGKRFDVAIEHLTRPDDRPLDEQVASAVGRLIDENLDGDVLVFLPGAAEIRRAQSACAAIAAKRDLLLLPLHGDLSPAEQDRAVKPSSKPGRRKIILSTNVAESSVTIDGVVAVIDSGLARIASHSPWSGLPTLNVGRVSKASAIQRSGRAGRTRPGRCLRLYTVQDFNARPDHDAAEIRRLDLAEPALELHAAGIADLRTFDWFEAPPESSIEAAENLLTRLGAIDRAGRMTEIGARMLRFPLHPRQSRMLVEAQIRGVGADMAIIAALIGERDILEKDLFAGGRDRSAQTARSIGPSDLLNRLDLFREAEAVRFSPETIRDFGLDPGPVIAVDRVRRQLLGARGSNSPRSNQGFAALPPPASPTDDALLISILAGYPDRVARRRSLKSDQSELLMSGGGGALLSPSSVVRGNEFMVAVDAEERKDASQRAGTMIRLASAIEPEWLIDLFAEQLTEVIDARWNAQAERVEVVQRLLYDQLVIDESLAGRKTGPEVSRVLADAALAAGLQRFVDPQEVSRFIARVSFVAQTFPDAAMTEFNDEDAQQALVDLCDGLRSFSELKNAAGKNGLIERLRSKLSGEQARLLSQMAPDFTSIAGRRQVKINYEQGRPPWIASRLQDFFGMTDGPKIAEGRVPLVLQMLAPNQRPVQVTTDLAGFWQRTYPSVRRELSRRYPRHKWPENPLK